MDITDLKQRVICQHHFAVEYIYQSGQRKLLRKNAVPLKFTQLTTDLGDIPPVCSTYVYCGTKRKNLQVTIVWLGQLHRLRDQVVVSVIFPVLKLICPQNLKLN
ncbi:uncharacterized protein LOC126890004 [Diabrotica virgifera virgifera]|uniref:Uncharacterized protein n=1 Tax=Diabrotica virgifera virgifera TaxID=50390 RepID=A0ABM5KX42_DIAVI|nr:uncharacterized protein LOC126890004 [Diabrotica virgifera virgifera]